MLEVCSIFVLPLVVRYLTTIEVCIWRMFVFKVCSSNCVEDCGNVCCVAGVVEDSFFSMGVVKYALYLCRGCDGCCVYIVRRGATVIRFIQNGPSWSFTNVYM